jgi:hypothetical protein
MAQEPAMQVDGAHVAFRQGIVHEPISENPASPLSTSYSAQMRR